MTCDVSGVNVTIVTNDPRSTKGKLDLHYRRM